VTSLQVLIGPYTDLSVTFGGDAGYGLTLVVSVEQTFSLFTSSDVRRRLLGPSTFFYFLWLSCF
jgi:hypothetical protein